MIKIAFFIAAFLLLFSSSISIVIPEKEPKNFRIRTLSEIRKAHLYHGILFSYVRERDKVWCFERNNQEIRLFKRNF